MELQIRFGLIKAKTHSIRDLAQSPSPFVRADSVKLMSASQVFLTDSVDFVTRTTGT